MTDIDSDVLLMEYALGSLSEAEREGVAHRLATDAGLARALSEIEAALSRVALELPTSPPPPALKTRLFASVEFQGRFLPFMDALCSIFDLARRQMDEIISWISDASRWEQTPLPNVALIHFAGGPGAAQLDCGIVRVQGGTIFPAHRHQGDERVFVLQGTFRDRVTGELHRPGDVVDRPAGSAHAFEVLVGEDLLFAVRHVGIDLIPDA